MTRTDFSDSRSVRTAFGVGGRGVERMGRGAILHSASYGQ